jgi:hypothetical protein
MRHLFSLTILSATVFLIQPVLVDTHAAAEEDKVLNKEVIERSFQRGKSILRPDDEVPMAEVTDRIKEPYDAEWEKFREDFYENLPGDVDAHMDELCNTVHDRAKRFCEKKERHFLEILQAGRFHEARIIHNRFYKLPPLGDCYDWDGHRSCLCMEAYETYLRLAREAEDRLNSIRDEVIALHAGESDPGFELVASPREEDPTDIDRLEEARSKLAAWQEERKHNHPGWPRRWGLGTGWGCRLGGEEVRSGAFGVTAELRNPRLPLAQEVRSGIRELVERNAWRLAEHAQSLGGRAAALNRFDEVMEVRTGSGYAVFRARFTEKAFVVLIPDGCDALLVWVYASRDYPEDLVRRNPVVVDEIVGRVVESFVGGGAPPSQDSEPVAQIALEPVSFVNLFTDPHPKSTCNLQVLAVRADGLPAGGIDVLLEEPELGRLSATRVRTDRRGQAPVTYTAPTEEQLAATGRKKVTVIIKARAPSMGAKDTQPVKVRSLTGEVTAWANEEILPAHPDYYNRIEFRFKAAGKPDGSPYRARITASQQWGAFVKKIHEPGGTRTFEMDVWPNSDRTVFYHWTGPPTMKKAAEETVTVEILEKKVKCQVSFSVGMDLRIVSVDRKYGGALYPVMWEPFHVYIEDKFHPDADLQKLLKKFRIQTDLEIEQTAYEPPAPDYSHGSLVSVLITRIEGMSGNDLQDAVVWDVGSWEVQKTQDSRYVLIQRGKYEDDTPWQEYPAVVFWERGTYRFQFGIRPGPFDADPRNNVLPSASLQVKEFRGFSDEVMHTVFLPSLEFLAGASLSFTKEGTVLAVKTAFCIKGLTGDVLAQDYGSLLIDVWGCALTGLDKADIPQEVKETFQLQELGTYVASLTKGLYEQAQTRAGHHQGESPQRERTQEVFNKTNSPLGAMAKGLYEESQGKEGALVQGLAKAVLDTGDHTTGKTRPHGSFSLDDVLRVSQMAVKGMENHYIVVLQREGLRNYTARTSGGAHLAEAPARLGPGKPPAQRIEETETTVVIPMRNDEQLILEIAGTGSHGRLITITPQRIAHYAYPGGTWQTNVVVDSSGRATFGAGQAVNPDAGPHSPPTQPSDGAPETASGHHPPAGSTPSFGGTWKSSFGTITVTQKGSRISGEYTHDKGKIEGTLEGNMIRGQWSESPSYQPPKDAGDFEFTMAADGNSFQGKWRYGFDSGSWRSGWNGERVR